MFSDTSQRAWGAVLVKDGLRQQMRYYGINLEGDINALEARALCNALSSFFPSIRNARIDVWTDNLTPQAAWENDGCRSSLVSQELKKLEEMSQAGNFIFISSISHRVKTLPTCPPVLCLILIVLCLTRRGPEFKRGLDHAHLT